MFIVHCAGCSEPLRLPDDAAGKTIRCLKCKAIILIPERPRAGETPSYSAGAETKNYESKRGK